MSDFGTKGDKTSGAQGARRVLETLQQPGHSQQRSVDQRQTETVEQRTQREDVGWKSPGHGIGAEMQK